MRSHHAWVVLLEYTVTARLVYRPAIDVRLMRPLLLAPLVLETNAPLAAYRQPHVCTNLLLIKPAAPIIAIYHILTSIAVYTKRHQLSPVSFALFSHLNYIMSRYGDFPSLRGTFQKFRIFFKKFVQRRFM